MNRSRSIASDPLMMSYIGPYTIASATVPSHVSLPFVVPAYLHSQMHNQSYFVALTFATTTTLVPQQTYILPQFGQAPPQYYQGPYVYPHLPTMKQMKLDGD